MTPVGHAVALPSGLRLNLLRWRSAAPSQPPALLVHGLGDTAWVWQGIAPALAERRDVLALDLRGHGGSDRVAADEYSVAAMAADLLSLADQQQLERPLLVGHSLGAAVAVHAAAAAVDRFAGLALVDYATEIAPASMKLVRAVLALMHGTYASVADYAAILKRRHLLAHSQLLDTIAAGALHATAGGHRPRFDPAVLDGLGEGDSLSATTERLARLHLPVLVVRGALSSMVSQHGARQLADACPSARLAVVPMAGHSAQIDNPQGLLKALGLLAQA